MSTDPIEYRKKMTEIQAFVEATPAWYDDIPEDRRHDPCAFCGVVPSNVYTLATSVKDIDGEIRERILRRLNEISYPELMNLIDQKRKAKHNNITPIEAYKEILIEIITT